MTTNVPIYVKFIGHNVFLQGVPERDMTREEWEAIDADTREKAVQLGLYKINDRKASKPADEKE